MVDFGSTSSSSPSSDAISIVNSGPIPFPSVKESKKGETPAPPLNGLNLGNGSKSKGGTNEPHFYSLHSEGTVVRWNCTTCEAEMVLNADEAGKEEEEIVKRQLIVPTNSFDGSTIPLLAQTFKDGRLRLFRLDDVLEPTKLVFDLPSSGGGGGGTIVALSTFPILSPVVGLAVEQSVVTISHAATGVTFYALSPLQPPTSIATIPPLDSPIRQIRLAPAPPDTFCSSCLETVLDGFLCTVSTRSHLKVFRIFTPPSQLRSKLARATLRSRLSKPQGVELLLSE